MSDESLDSELGLDTTRIISAVISSECDLYLAAERLSTPEHRVNDYDINEIITSDPEIGRLLANKLRSLTVVKLFRMLTDVHNQLMGKIDELGPRDLMRLHMGTLNAFNMLTAPSAKDVFDLEDEIRKATTEFTDIDENDLKKELKQLLAGRQTQ